MREVKGDILILGAGVVGLSLAYRLVERGISKKYSNNEKKKKSVYIPLVEIVAFFIQVYITNQKR